MRRLAVPIAVCALWCLSAAAAEERPVQPAPAVESDHPWTGYAAAGLVFGAVYAIGKQNNGEKVLGTLYLAATGVGHSSDKRAGMGLLALSAYNFFYLTRGDISNERVARDNVIGLGLLIGLAYLADGPSKARDETSKSPAAFLSPDPERRGVIAGIRHAF